MSDREVHHLIDSEIIIPPDMTKEMPFLRHIRMYHYFIEIITAVTLNPIFFPDTAEQSWYSTRLLASHGK